MEDEISEFSSPENGQISIDYGDYVSHLCKEFPHLEPLEAFLNLKEPTGCVPDRITVMDASKDGNFQDEQFSTVGPTGQGQQLTEKLRNHPPDLKIRVICVSQLTPISAKILGQRYNLSADFLNSHLPVTNTLARVPSKSSCHINFLETYRLDRPFETIFPGEKLDKDNEKWHFLLFAMVHQSLDYLYIKPKHELLTLKEDMAFFYVKQRISMHTAQERTTRIVIFLYYPTLQPASYLRESDVDTMSTLERRQHSYLQFRRKLDTLPTPSKCDLSRSFQGSLKNLDKHLCARMKRQLRKAPMDCHHRCESILYQVFRLIVINWTTTIQQMQLEVNEVDSFERLTKPTGDNFEVDRQKTVIADCREQLSAAITIVRATGPKRPKIRSGIEGQDSDPESDSPEFRSLIQRWSCLELQFEHIRSRLNSFHEKADNASKARLMFVQIVESRKAIAQADSVRRLTNLAFVFIPLTFVAGVFSANIREMDNHRTAKAFAISAVVTTALAILAALVLEQYLWPALLWPFRKWKTSIWAMFSELKRGDAAYHMDRPSGWFLLPLRTIELGWLWLQYLWALHITRKVGRSNADQV